MTQHIQFCQQLFKHLNISYDYPLTIDPLAPSGHDEFGLVVGEQVTDFFAQMRKEKNIQSPKTTTTKPVDEPYQDPYSGDYGQYDDDEGLGRNAQNETQLGRSGQNWSKSGQKDASKSSFSVRDGYDGFIGILEMKLSFPRVFAEIAPYASHQAASRYAKYTLERSFKKRMAKIHAKHLEDKGGREKGVDEGKGMTDDVDQVVNGAVVSDNHHEDSDFEPIININSDQVASKLKQKANVKKKSNGDNNNNHKGHDNETSSTHSTHSTPAPPPDSLTLSESKRLEDEFDRWCDDMLLVDRDWSQKVSQKLVADFLAQQNNPHPIIPGYQSVVLELPPYELNVPSRFYDDKYKRMAKDKDHIQKKQQQETSTTSSPPSSDPTTKILIPLPKIRLSGHLDHTVIYPRPHANLIVRELLSNAIENTVKNTLELSKTTTTHLIHDKIYPDFVRFNGNGGMGDEKDSASASSSPKLLWQKDDPRHNLVTAGLRPEDYIVLNQHAQIPPIEVWITKASSMGKIKSSTGDGSDSLTTPSPPPPHPDDVLSIKISDRANGLNQHRAKAVLTYGNALIQGHLNNVRKFKQQQQHLNDFSSQVEHMRSEHYLKYGIGDSGHAAMTATTTASSTDTPHHHHHDHLHNNDLLGQTNIPPFIPPPLPIDLRPENLVSVHIPTADHYGPSALEQLCVESHPPRGFGLPLAKATVHFLHGELKLNSVDGFGTDAYVRLVV
jgi:hypothetical protein